MPSPADPKQAAGADLATLLAAVPLHERARGVANLAAIATVLSSDIVGTLPNLLADSPDPDAALNLFERLCRNATPELLRLFERHRFLVHHALVVFGYSAYLGDTLIASPDLFEALAHKNALERSLSSDEYGNLLTLWLAQRPSDDPALLLARFKRRSYVRILLRDVLGIATLAEIAAELSALAEALIREAGRIAEEILRKRLRAASGADPAPMAVLGLGKVGGNELNYSSDVDLLFLYEDEARLPYEIGSREYFIRLAQQLTELLSRPTTEGPVFRIDLRLRPQGREGEPAIALQQALRYYSGVARDWELQAMIKARHLAGDESLSREFIRGVQPFVYKAQLNFVAIETALTARRRMGQRRAGGLWARHSQPGIDVKVDRGGIRDIEFLAQCLQRVYGGGEPWLRSSGTLFALQKLHDKGHLSGHDFHHLSSAYQFLRNVEHRLQLRNGQQTHRLPESESDLRFLFRAIGGEPGETAAADKVRAAVTAQMAAVAEIYGRIIHQQQAHEGEPEFALTAPAEIADQSYQQVLRRLASAAPQLHAIAAATDISPRLRRNLHRFLSAALTSPDRFAAIADQPQGLERAMRLFESSDFLTDLMLRHPEEIVFLAELPRAVDGTGELFVEEPTAASPNWFHASSPNRGYGARLEDLRRHFRRNSLRAGAHDLLRPRGIFRSLQETTRAAEEAIAAALEIAEPPPGFAVLALGRLGSQEFDIASDADLVFVRHARTKAQEATRAAERVVQVLAAYTSEGSVFSVDSRLRPRGSEGELVVTPAHLDAYFAREAQLWEALTYTKLRHIAGDARLSAATIDAVRRHFGRFSNDPEFVPQLRGMRARLEASDREPNLKTIAGGVYDIDFIAGAMLVQHGGPVPRGNIRQALNDLKARGLLVPADHALLSDAAELLLTVEHLVRLVLGRPRKWLPSAERPRAMVEQLARTMLRPSMLPSDSLEEVLRSSFSAVRALFDRLLPAT